MRPLPQPAGHSAWRSLRTTGKHNLPAPRTSFVGREREIVEVKRTLAMTRLLTLTGAGGSGKTRLALEVARDLVGAYPDGVWLVELAPLSEAALVPQAVAAALGVREQPGQPLIDTLVGRLAASRQMLLVLDNCEHLVDAAAQSGGRAPRSCPRLRILATSREALGVRRGTTWPVPPLSVPDPRQPPDGRGAGRVRVGAAVRGAGRATRSRLRVDARERAGRGGDLPAAGRHTAGHRAGGGAGSGCCPWSRSRERLDDSLELLTGGGRTALRPGSRRCAGRWTGATSCSSEPERMLFGRLSVFAGGWTLEAAEAVWSGSGIDEGDVLDLLSRLGGQVAGRGRSRQQEVRCATGCSSPSGSTRRRSSRRAAKAEAARRRHAGYYLALAERPSRS